MKTTIVSIALLLALTATAKEGFHDARPTSVMYDDRGAVFLGLTPRPTDNGFRCDTARLWATETRRHRMLEMVMADAPHLPILSFWLEDVAGSGSDTCRATAVVRAFVVSDGELISTAPPELPRR